jgi:hypothetical protein
LVVSCEAIKRDALWLGRCGSDERPQDDEHDSVSHGSISSRAGLRHRSVEGNANQNDVLEHAPRVFFVNAVTFLIRRLRDEGGEVADPQQKARHGPPRHRPA